MSTNIPVVLATTYPDVKRDVVRKGLRGGVQIGDVQVAPRVGGVLLQRSAVRGLADSGGAHHELHVRRHWILARTRASSKKTLEARLE